jgi:hypothetical protein
MKLDRNMAVLLLVPVIGLAVPVAVLFWKLPAGGLTTTEQEILRFSSQPLAVASLGAPPSYSGAENPVHTPRPGTVTPLVTAFPPGPIPKAEGTRQAATPREGTTLPYLSMIYSDGGVRMAVIDGHVLREGGAVNGHTVVKIDKTRVLTRTAGKELWLSID